MAVVELAADLRERATVLFGRENDSNFSTLNFFILVQTLSPLVSKVSFVVDGFSFTAMFSY